MEGVRRDLGLEGFHITSYTPECRHGGHVEVRCLSTLDVDVPDPGRPEARHADLSDLIWITCCIGGRLYACDLLGTRTVQITYPRTRVLDCNEVQQPMYKLAFLSPRMYPNW